MTPEVEAVLRTLPRKIKVGAYDWRITFQDGANEKCGEADFEFHRVTLWPDNLIDPQHAVGIVIHEILHIIFDDRSLVDALSSGDDQDDQEESIVVGFETGLVSLYRDNPKLLTWIKRGLKST